jgi:hypothetical protein
VVEEDVFSKSPTIDDEEDGAYLPIHMPSDVGVRRAANDHEHDEAMISQSNEDDTDDHAAEVVEGVTEGETNIDAATTTRSALTYLIAYELGNMQYEIKLTKAEEQFYAQRYPTTKSFGWTRSSCACK